MKLYKLNSSSRGSFLIPHNGGRHLGFHHHQHLSTNGTGLLLSKDLGGFGVSHYENHQHMTPSYNMSSIQNKLNKLSIGGKVGKKKYISFKI